jgi:diphthamide synthase (EF-2-diphthine--ammonia ligase)
MQVDKYLLEQESKFNRLISAKPNTGEKLPFHAWKHELVQLDAELAGVTLKFREREWYWSKYGAYCKGFNDAP